MFLLLLYTEQSDFHVNALVILGVIAMFNHKYCEQDPCYSCSMSIKEKQQQRQQDHDDNIGFGARMWNPPRKVSNNDKN